MLLLSVMASPVKGDVSYINTETLNITVHVNFWAILVKFKFWFSRSGLGLEILHF